MARGDRSPETRDALLGAAARVFVRRGRYGATVREIVGEAGLTAPALYYHFEGKEDVYNQLVRSGSERLRALIEEALEAKEPLERLTGIARACIRFAAEDRTRLRVFYAELFRPGAPEDADPDLRDLRGWTRERVEEILCHVAARGNGRSAGARGHATASRLFVAMLSGLLAEQARQPDEAVLDDGLAGEAVRIFLHGVRSVEE